MTAQYVAGGGRIDHNPVSAVTAGDTIVFDSAVLGVYTRDYAAGEFASAAIAGEFEFPTSEVSINVGSKVGWDDAAKEITAAGGGDFDCGFCVAAVSGGKVRVILAPGV